MHPISLNAVPKWITWNKRWIPISVNTICPYCGMFVNLNFQNQSFDQGRDTISASSVCPSCQKESHFWIIKPRKSVDPQQSCDLLCIYPIPRLVREPIIEVDKIPQAIASSYLATIASYNASIWIACGVSCRRTLEGLVKDILDNKFTKESLFNQLESLPEKVNLTKPLIHLAESIRKGGNIAAHFDSEKEPDQKVAEAMIDLLEYFIEYVYIFKIKSEELEIRLDSLGK
jgi:hypothetical protein